MVCSKFSKIAKSPLHCCSICEKGPHSSFSMLNLCFTSTCPVAQVKQNGVGGNTLLIDRVCELRVAVLSKSEVSGGSSSLRKQNCQRVVLLFRHVEGRAHLMM